MRKTVFFIDWQSLEQQSTVGSAPVPIDPSLLMSYLASLGYAINIRVYLTEVNGTGRPGRLSSLSARLKKHRNLVVIEKVVERRHYLIPTISPIRLDGNVDVEIAMDVMDLLYLDEEVQQMVFLCGSENLASLLRRIQNNRTSDKRIRTILIARTSVSEKLKRAVDEYIPLRDFSQADTA